MLTTANDNLLQVDKRVKKAFVAGAKGYKSHYEQVFIVETPERRNEKYTIVKTNSGVQEVNDGSPYPVQGIEEISDATISVRVYKSAIVISDLAEAFDNYGAIERTAKMRGYHFKAKMDQLGADFLNNPLAINAPYGFNIASTTTSLVSTTQPIGDTGLVQSNRITAALNKTSFNDANVALMTQRDHDGMLVNYQADRLVVSAYEGMNAWQLARSWGEPESANRNDNYLRTLNINPIVWPLLNQNVNFLMADKSDTGAKGLRYLVKELPSARRILDQRTGNPMYQMRMIIFPGVVDYQGMVGIIA